MPIVELYGVPGTGKTFVKDKLISLLKNEVNISNNSNLSQLRTTKRIFFKLFFVVIATLYDNFKN